MSPSVVREELNNTKQSRQTDLTGRFFLFLLFAAIETVFLFPQFSTFVGPVIALLFLYTYFVMRETVLVTAIIVMANDALGTILLGKVSFHYLLIFFVAVELFRFRGISLRTLGLVLLASLLCGQLVFVGNISFRQAAWAVLFFVAFVVQYAKYQNDHERFFDELCFGFAIILALISIHALLTGGVEFYEQSAFSQHYLRKGILGAGIGDSNFSCILLNTGIIGALNCSFFGRNTKIILIALMVATVSITLSVTGLVSLIAIFIYYFSAKKKGVQSLLVILLVIAIMVLMFSVYTHLPGEYHVEAVDEYIERITEKLDLFAENDVDTATSSRSRIARKYLNYIVNEQSLWKSLFGGNGIMLTGGVPHNTYIDWILQLGWLGFAVMIFVVIRRLRRVWHLPPTVSQKRILIMMKCLLLFFAFSLSIYDGASFGLLFFFLFFV